MMDRIGLGGVKVIVAGAGLAGLSAARELEARGAAVTVIEARNRVGGRVWTMREQFAGPQHAEAGADLIDGDQAALLDLARELRLRPVRILRRGFGFYGADDRGRRRIHRGPVAWELLPKLLHDEIEDFRLTEERWDSAVARRLAQMSVARWLDDIRASPGLRASMRGFRGFFLADPETLSMLPLVEQFAEFGNPAQGRLFRLAEGNDALATRIADLLKGRVLLNTIVRRVAQRNDRVSVIVDDEKKRHRELDAAFFVCALPATTARDVVFAPALPDAQHDAIARLRYGCATRLMLQFERRFWNKRGRPAAFGTDLPVGAIWDGNEQQAGACVLSFLAGGQASGALQDLLRREGDRGVIEQIEWLGRPSKLLASQTVVWEDDPWALGGYAYFDPSYDPLWREWLARPFGRITFAGEHMSIRWQGYMNGAVETGRRAAAEVAALRASVPDALRL